MPRDPSSNMSTPRVFDFFPRGMGRLKGIEIQAPLKLEAQELLTLGRTRAACSLKRLIFATRIFVPSTFAETPPLLAEDIHTSPRMYTCLP